MKSFYAKLVFVVASISGVTAVSHADDSPDVVPRTSPSVKAPVRPQVSTPKNRPGVRTLKAFQLRCRAIAFSPHGNVMACVTEDYNNIWVWDLVADQAVRVIKVPVPSPQEQRDALKSSRILPDPNWTMALAFSSDGKTLAAGSSKIRLWDVETGQLRHTLELSGKEDEKRVSALAFSPNGKILAAGNYGGSLRLWDAKTWQWKGTLHEGGHSSIENIAFAPDSLHLACAGTSISLWDIAKKVRVRSFKEYTDHPAGLVFSPDGQTLVVGGGKTPYTEDWSIFDYGGFFGVVYIWDVETGALRKTITFKDESVRSLAYAPDGLTLAVGYYDVVRLWSTRDWRLQESLPSSSTNSISYVEGSKTLALVSESEGAKLWSPSFLNQVRLGIWMQKARLDKRSIRALGLKQNSGARIVSVTPGSIAAQRGLRKNDIILRINGRTVDSLETVSESIQSLGSGEAVVLSVLRQGQLLTVPVQLAHHD